jgi:hypothetical protein
MGWLASPAEVVLELLVERKLRPQISGDRGVKPTLAAQESGQTGPLTGDVQAIDIS